MTNRRILILCECCALKLTNDDESGCRDYHHHTHAGLEATGHLVLTHQDARIWDGVHTPDCHGHGGQITNEKFWVAEQIDTSSDSAPTWPQTKAEHDLFQDWQYEVAAGDTLHGFRDWVNARDEQEVDDLVAASYPGDTP